MSLKKPRPDAKLLGLSEAQQMQLSDWMLTPGLSYAKIKALIKADFGVSTSAAALSCYYTQFVSQELLRRRARIVSVCDQFTSEAQRSPGTMDRATIDAIAQKAFELSISPGADPDDLQKMMTLILKARDQDLKGEALKLQTRRLELLEAERTQVKDKLTKIVEKGGLSPEALKEIEQAARILQ